MNKSNKTQTKLIAMLHKTGIPLRRINRSWDYDKCYVRSLTNHIVYFKLNKNGLCAYRLGNKDREFYGTAEEIITKIHLILGIKLL